MDLSDSILVRSRRVEKMSKTALLVIIYHALYGSFFLSGVTGQEIFSFGSDISLWCLTSVVRIIFPVGFK
jgi:hypothetical protein